MKLGFVVLVLLISTTFFISISNGGLVMPWMGLERTDENITSDLNQIRSISGLLGAVSFERFNLGPNSELIVNNFTDPQYVIQSECGLLALPMISSCCPWGRPEVIEYARELFKNPMPFIESAIEHALNEGFDGYNVDIEPGVNQTTSNDAVQYAAFIDLFAKELHQYGKILTVDAASYAEFWNFTLLGQTEVDYIFTMSTYASSLTDFTNALDYAVQTIPLDKLAIGVMTVDANNQPFSTQELATRFQLLSQAGVQNLGIWASPLPSNWLPFLKQFATVTSKSTSIDK